MINATSKMRLMGSSVSLESLEWWKNAFEIGGVVLLLMTFFAGFGAWWFSRQVNAVQAEQLRQFEKDLVEAKTQNLKLEALIQPRSLSASQQREIGTALSSFKGRKLTLFSLAWDPEGYGLSKQIASALLYGELNVIDRSGSFASPLAVSVRGVSIVWWPSDSERKFAEAMADSLKQIGNLKDVSVSKGNATVDGKADPNPSINLFVHPKPFEVISAKETN